MKEKEVNVSWLGVKASSCNNVYSYFIFLPPRDCFLISKDVIIRFLQCSRNQIKDFSTSNMISFNTCLGSYWSQNDENDGK